jgi:hypothetical protein
MIILLEFLQILFRTVILSIFSLDDLIDSQVSGFIYCQLGIIFIINDHGPFQQVFQISDALDYLPLFE